MLYEVITGLERRVAGQGREDDRRAQVAEQAEDLAQRQQRASYNFV